MRKSPSFMAAGAILQAAALSALLLAAPIAPAPPAEGADPSPGLAESLSAVESLIKEDDYQAALERARATASDFPSSAEALALHGLALLRAGGFVQAGTEIRRALAADPECADAHLGAGRLALWTNRKSEARGHLAKAIGSSRFAGEAYRELSRLHAEEGDFLSAAAFAKEALARTPYLPDKESRSSIAYYEFLGSARYFEIPGDFTRTTAKLAPEPGVPGGSLRLVSISVNGKGPWSFHVDSASPFNMILGPRVASELELPRAGGFSVGGVGPGRREMEGSFVEEIRIGDLIVKKVPVVIMDSPTFRGETAGLIGTGLLRKFNVTLDPRAGTLELFRQDRHDLLAAGIREEEVVARAPIYHTGTPVVPVSVGSGPAEPFILDTAASATLLDQAYFDRHVAPSLGEGGFERVRIRGVGGEEEAASVPSASIRIGGRRFEGVRVLVMDMSRMTRMARKYAAGVLGNNLLWDCRIHLDYADSELLLESPPPAGP